ncbi:MAG: hypothetical protein K6G51_04575 [Sphaerochaetaceae bacterium]|nr:hypothetical protein [Sphaerochaetaceae bacterium]
MALFDFTDGNVCFDFGKKQMINANGDIMQKLSNFTAMDMNTGEIHFGSFGSFDNSDEEHQDF